MKPSLNSLCLRKSRSPLFWRTSWQHVLAFSAMILVPHVRCTAAGSPATQPASAKLWTPIAICSALAFREGRLQNSSIKLTEERWVSNNQGSAEELRRIDSVSVRLTGAKVLMDLSEQNFNNPELSLEHALYLWDGASVKYLQGKAPATGVNTTALQPLLRRVHSRFP
jgi:hypothetical protein